MKISWIDKADGIGNSFGYATHQSNLLKALKSHGVEIDDKAEMALHIKPLLHYERIPNKINVVYTMYEYVDLPPWWIEKLNDIDHIIVPCEHNRQLFSKCTDKPISVCLEGVDTQLYKFKHREFPKDKPFRFYWFGAGNPRKGYFSVLVAWDKWIRLFPQWRDATELYIKIGDNNKRGVKKTDNVIYDNRVVSNEELVKLNHAAHAFIFPTMGEGFGLTLVEAIATGLPSIYTNYSGPEDYLNNDRGYPIGYTLTDVETYERVDGEKQIHKTKAAYADPDDLVAQMAHIFLNYKKALWKGHNAAQYTREVLTWDASARKLIKILKQIKEN